MGVVFFGRHGVWSLVCSGFGIREFEGTIGMELRRLCDSIALQKARRKGRLDLSDFQFPKHLLWAGHLAVCISCLLVILLPRCLFEELWERGPQLIQVPYLVLASWRLGRFDVVFHEVSHGPP